MIKSLMVTIMLTAAIFSGVQSQTMDDYHRYFKSSPLTLKQLRHDVSVFDSVYNSQLIRDTATLSRLLCFNRSLSLKNYFDKMVMSFYDVDSLLENEPVSKKYLIENEALLKRTRYWRMSGAAFAIGGLGVSISALCLFGAAARGGEVSSVLPWFYSSFAVMMMGVPGKFVTLHVENRQNKNIYRAIYEYNGVQILNHYN